MYDLFEDQTDPNRKETVIDEGAVLLPGFVDNIKDIQIEVERIVSLVPFRKMTTPGGYQMSVGLTSCGQFGWVSDHLGYRYSTTNPDTGKHWPPMPLSLYRLAQQAAEHAGYSEFEPDACLINCYEPGAKMSLHQDKDEHDFQAPIVSVSLGLPAVFLFGGPKRSDKAQKYRLEHGDVVIWGGKSRLYFHGVEALQEGYHESLGAKRINLTFRKAR